MKAQKQFKLCSDCPMRSWISEARQRIEGRGFGLNDDKPISALKICMELRVISKENGLKWCPHYPESESLDFFWGEKMPKCYFNTQSCCGELWQCRTCGEWFCQYHWHETDKGRNVECVACERERKAPTEELGREPTAAEIEISRKSTDAAMG